VPEPLLPFVSVLAPSGKAFAPLGMLGAGICNLPCWLVPLLRRPSCCAAGNSCPSWLMANVVAMLQLPAQATGAPAAAVWPTAQGLLGWVEVAKTGCPPLFAIVGRTGGYEPASATTPLFQAAPREASATCKSKRVICSADRLKPSVPWVFFAHVGGGEAGLPWVLMATPPSPVQSAAANWEFTMLSTGGTGAGGDKPFLASCMDGCVGVGAHTGTSTKSESGRASSSAGAPSCLVCSGVGA